MLELDLALLIFTHWGFGLTSVIPHSQCVVLSSSVNQSPSISYASADLHYISAPNFCVLFDIKSLSVQLPQLIFPWAMKTSCLVVRKAMRSQPTAMTLCTSSPCWQRVNDVGTFIGVDASVAVAIGIDLQLGFYLPSNGRC